MWFVLVGAGMLTWLIGGNWILRRHSRTRRVFGRRWPVRVDLSDVTAREWLQLLVIAIAALAVVLLGLIALQT
jgi:hypothetical protein